MRYMACVNVARGEGFVREFDESDESDESRVCDTHETAWGDFDSRQSNAWPQTESRFKTVCCGSARHGKELMPTMPNTSAMERVIAAGMGTGVGCHTIWSSGSKPGCGRWLRREPRKSTLREYDLSLGGRKSPR